MQNVMRRMSASVVRFGWLLDAAVEARRDLAPGDGRGVEGAQRLAIPSVALLVEILHRLAREQVVVVEVAQPQRFEEIVVQVIRLASLLFVAAAADQDFPVLVMLVVLRHVPFLLPPARNPPLPD